MTRIFVIENAYLITSPRQPHHVAQRTQGVTMNVKTSLILIGCLSVTACGDNPFNDNKPINDNDYSLIRIEMDRCSHIDKEGSWAAQFRISPKTSCLNHLKKRIVHTGIATPEGLEQ